MNFFYLLLCAAGLLCSGCLPTRFADTPHITGAVVDAGSRSPIVGARLHYAAFPQHEAYTGTRGEYDLPTVSHWGLLVLLPIDRAPRVAVLTVEATNYVSTNVEVCNRADYTNQTFYLVPQ